jgi:hypothetical protein
MREPYERTRVAGEVLRARDGLATLPARLPTCAERARKRKPGMNAAEIVELPARSPDHVCTGQSRRASSFLWCTRWYISAETDGTMRAIRRNNPGRHFSDTVVG